MRQSKRGSGFQRVGFDSSRVGRGSSWNIPHTLESHREVGSSVDSVRLNFGRYTQLRPPPLATVRGAEAL